MDENVEETFGANVLKKEGKKHGDDEKAGKEQTAETADQRKSTGKQAADQQKQPADTADRRKSTAETREAGGNTNRGPKEVGGGKSVTNRSRTWKNQTRNRLK